MPLYWRPSNASSCIFYEINSLNAELNFICHLLTLLGAHHILRVSRIRVKSIEVSTLLIFMAVLWTYIVVQHRKQFGSNGKAYYYYSCDALIQYLTWHQTY